MKNGRPKGAPTEAKIKNDNNISDEQCSPLQNAGITLIALIITIILLLILAGVTIHFTIGENGILRHAELAGNKYKISGENEADLLDDIELYMNGEGSYPSNTPDTNAGERVAMPDGWYSETSATYEVPEVREVTNAKRAANVYAVSDGQNNTIPIPKDFYYVGGNINSGIVISDNKDDEKKYANSSNGDVGKDLKGNQFVWIPCSLENYHKIDWKVDIGGKWELETGDIEKYQIEKYGGFYIGRYEAGVSVLDKTKGTFIDYVTFKDGKTLNGKITTSKDIHEWNNQTTDYLARNDTMKSLLGDTYGVNKATGNVVVQADAIPYYNADYYTAKEMSNRLYKNKSSVKSGLVTGTQWDVMMKYMQDNGVAVKGAECNWGNYGNVKVKELTGYYVPVDGVEIKGAFRSCNELEGNATDDNITTNVLLTTGASEHVKKMNLYDVAGNLWEWTDEAEFVSNFDYKTSDYNTYSRRGGAYFTNGSELKACYRAYDNALDTSNSGGIRVVLYIQ